MITPKHTQKLISAKQKQGASFEALALAFLQEQGLILIAQNWLCPKVGELDLVMRDHDTLGELLVFIEVRQRTSHQYGGALDSISRHKQKKIIQTAQRFLTAHPQYHDYGCRFDVVSFDGKQTGSEPTQWIQNAFWIE